MNISWYSSEVPYKDTLMFASSISQRFTTSQLYSQAPHADYCLKGVVCFLGAHYMTFIKHRATMGEALWKLYDDSKQIQIFTEWCEVVNKIMSFSILPTLLVYERTRETVSELGTGERLSTEQIAQLVSQAKTLSDFMDQFNDHTTQPD